MKKFKVGVWVDASFIPESGGGHSFLYQLIESIDEKKFRNEIEIFFVGFNLKTIFKKEVINLSYSESPLYQKKVNFFHKYLSINIIRKDIEKNYIKAEQDLRKLEIDIIFYPTPDVFLQNYPYIIMNWDLAHRTTHPFPEVAMFGNWENREKKIHNNLNKALLICAESETGKNEIINHYNISADKITILPLFPSKIISENIIPKKPEWLNSDTKFFIYPAQFWAHKNHYNLIIAFKSFIEDNNQDYILILSGSDQGNGNYIKSLIKELGLEHAIKTPGFIADQHLKWLYKNSEGLVFPTLLGPTNMPLLEALHLNCKIACSNLKGHKAMIGDLAIYFDPLDPNSIKQSLDILKTNDNRNLSTTKLKNVLEYYTLENAIIAFESTITKSMNIKRTWGF